MEAGFGLDNARRKRDPANAAAEGTSSHWEKKTDGEKFLPLVKIFTFGTPFKGLIADKGFCYAAKNLSQMVYLCM